MTIAKQQRLYETMQSSVTCVVKAVASTTRGQQTTYDQPTQLAHYWQRIEVATADEATSH